MNDDLFLLSLFLQAKAGVDFLQERKEFWIQHVPSSNVKQPQHKTKVGGKKEKERGYKSCEGEKVLDFFFLLAVGRIARGKSFTSLCRVSISNETFRLIAKRHFN